MSMRILNVAYPFAPVGADAVGGAEQVLTRLDAALVRHGHGSVVLACAGSKTAGTLVAGPPVAGAITDEVRRHVHERYRVLIDQTIERRQIDLVHMHGIDFCSYLPGAEVPVLATLHLPLAWYLSGVFHLSRARTYLQPVSKSQAEARPPRANILPPIDNGVPIPARLLPHARRCFALALGRICPEKGFHHALDAAAQAGCPLLIGGAVFPYEAHERYFREEIQPRLGRHARFLGPLGPRRKRRLLSAARCLLVPSMVPETSSLVAMEALAHGTPVIAFRAGALVDIVEHGRTGFLVRDANEMADAINSIDMLDRSVCRDVAKRRCDVKRMTDAYLQRYHTLIHEAVPDRAHTPRQAVALV